MIATHPNADRSSTISAELLRCARQCAGLSLTAAAECADVSRSALSAYESGVRLPSLEKLLGILESLQFSVRIELEPQVRQTERRAAGRRASRLSGGLGCLDVSEAYTTPSAASLATSAVDRPSSAP